MKAKNSVSLKKIAGQNILVDLDQSCINFNKMITVNETGAYIWECLAKDISMTELQQIVADFYEEKIENVKDDVIDFVYKMQELGLIIDAK